MKRLALLAVAACMAVILSACGENTQRKVEDSSMTGTQQQDSLGNAVKDTDSKLQPGATDTSGSPANPNPPSQTGQ
ncbi:hypothetical protein [Legionella fairfieldensis]|uniref:hypothetical protein n=1 Tax=Legionella fairfieldensis TaxID=45064 RepID=UPI00048AAFDB|nr:hypothetical protein [Legionella fairfieldensis]